MKDNNIKITTSVEQDAKILTFLFITLKLCGVINWAWWWVLSPLPLAVALVILSGVAVGVYKGVKK